MLYSKILTSYLTVMPSLCTGGTEGGSDNMFLTIIEPVTELLTMVVPAALALVGVIGSIYCILLGVKLAKAEEQQDREKAKGALKNALIGFIAILAETLAKCFVFIFSFLILILALNIGMTFLDAVARLPVIL